MSTGLSDDCARLLAFQHEVIARWQAPAVGLSPATIDALLRRGRWRPLYWGIYAAYTGDPPRESLLWAGVLRAGPGAVLSHHTAAGELEVGEGDAGVGQAVRVDHSPGPDQGLDVFVDVPDVDVHPGHDDPVGQPERDELQ